MAEFQNDVQKWVQIDNEIKRASTHVKTLRETRNNLSDKILSMLMNII